MVPPASNVPTVSEADQIRVLPGKRFEGQVVCAKAGAAVNQARRSSARIAALLCSLTLLAVWARERCCPFGLDAWRFGWVTVFAETSSVNALVFLAVAEPVNDFETLTTAIY